MACTFFFLSNDEAMPKITIVILISLMIMSLEIKKRHNDIENKKDGY